MESRCLLRLILAIALTILYFKTLSPNCKILLGDLDDKFLVLDSSLYNTDFLRNKSISSHWITRVPESVKTCKEALSKKRYLWTKVDKDFKYYEMLSDYGGRRQRWIVVQNREDMHKEQSTLKKKLDREEQVITKSCQKLSLKIFVLKEELREVIENQGKQHPLFTFNHQILGVFKKFPNSKRKIKVGYKIIYRFTRNEIRIEKLPLPRMSGS